MKLELKRTQSNMRDVESYHRKISGHKVKDWGAAGVVLDGDVECRPLSLSLAY